MTTTPPSPTSKNLLLLAGAAIGVGALAGLVTTFFRLGLEHADQWRAMLLAWAQGRALPGLLLSVAGVAGLTAVAAWLVRRFAPHAGGSGIPHVEAVVNNELPPAPLRLLPVKFVGGWLAIGGGLALGREGPSVQMGACLGSEIGRWLRLEKSDVGALLAAGAGAGLATAFNAPIAGAVFVLEELVRRFDTCTAIAALGASAGAIAISRLFLGDDADFRVGQLPYPPNGSGLLFLAVGVLAGFVGMAYNRLLLGTLAISDRWAHRPIELRAALIGASVGALAWFAPGLVGGGDALTQSALNAGATGSAALLMVFGLRFVLGAASYAAGTPGGLFAPMLVLGAQLGLLFAWVCHSTLPGINVSPTAFAVVGMAAFFTAVVRAPVTGIILTVELTGEFTQLLPMLWACFAAMAVPTLLGDQPIYTSLKERTLRLQA
ncbi:MAG TPA: H(+)/Cl(-) exchange transporter ClcA [Verrucomicrobiae bacterium]|nr:H(+)/Cl(-) exchange transporter ClcA [Verrucomicrobiae bacterium]